MRNILDRKNTEISDVKLFYQKKMGDLDELVKSRDTVIATLTEKLNTMEQKYLEEVRIYTLFFLYKNIEAQIWCKIKYFQNPSENADI